MQNHPEKKLRKRTLPTEPTTASSPRAPDGPTLSLHPKVTPLSCVGSSAVPQKALAVIEWTLFDGVTQDSAIRLYNNFNKEDKKVKTNDAISYMFRRYGPVWYKEQGVVRPWKLYTKQEKAEMAKQGLGEDDFPLIHPRDLPKDKVEQNPDDVDVSSEEPVKKRRRFQTRSDEQDFVHASQLRMPLESALKTKFVPANLPHDTNGSDERLSKSHGNGPSSRDTSSASSMMPPRNDRLFVKLKVRIPPNYRAFDPANPSVDPPVRPIPDALKAAILNKRQEWQDTTARFGATVADPIEEEWEALEKEAIALDETAFRAWKFGIGGYAYWKPRARV